MTPNHKTAEEAAQVAEELSVTYSYTRANRLGLDAQAQAAVAYKAGFMACNEWREANPPELPHSSFGVFLDAMNAGANKSARDVVLLDISQQLAAKDHALTGALAKIAEQEAEIERLRQELRDRDALINVLRAPLNVNKTSA